MHKKKFLKMFQVNSIIQNSNSINIFINLLLLNKHIFMHVECNGPMYIISYNININIKNKLKTNLSEFYTIIVGILHCIFCNFIAYFIASFDIFNAYLRFLVN